MFGKKRQSAHQLADELAYYQQIINTAGGPQALNVAQMTYNISQQHQQVSQSLAQAQAAQANLENTQQARQNELDAYFQRKKQKLRQQAEADKALLESAMQHETDQLNQVKQKIKETKKELREIQSIYRETNDLLEAGLTDYKTPAASSMELGAQLAEVSHQIKKMVTDKTATTATASFTFNDSETKGRKFVNDMSKMMLRAYNSEAENCVLKVKAGNGEASQRRLDRCREQVHKLGKMINLDISPEYHRLRLKEIELTLNYQLAKKREKEDERERRAQLREEAKAQAELAREREKLEKQKAHYETVYKRLIEQGRNDEATEYEMRLEKIGEDIIEVENRAANVRAGYVYVISNIGSFGPGVVKIGMTRRVNPLDRVHELSDASVPFNFDVHALFFSEDAVGVETRLHQEFAKQRINLINKRREFFAVSPLQVKEKLRDIQGDLLEFVEVPDADQYRQSQQIRSAENDISVKISTRKN